MTASQSIIHHPTPSHSLSLSPFSLVIIRVSLARIASTRLFRSIPYTLFPPSPLHRRKLPPDVRAQTSRHGLLLRLAPFRPAKLLPHLRLPATLPHSRPQSSHRFPIGGILGIAEGKTSNILSRNPGWSLYGVRKTVAKIMQMETEMRLQTAKTAGSRPALVTAEEGMILTSGRDCCHLATMATLTLTIPL